MIASIGGDSGRGTVRGDGIIYELPRICDTKTHSNMELHLTTWISSIRLLENNDPR